MDGSYIEKVSDVFSIALTKLDILDGLEELKIGVDYRINGEVLQHFPGNYTTYCWHLYLSQSVKNGHCA